MLHNAGEKKDKKDKREARKARKKAGATGDGNAAADRLPTAGELAAAGARLGPRVAAEEAHRRSQEEAAMEAAAGSDAGSSSEDEVDGKEELQECLKVQSPRKRKRITLS